MKAAPGVLLHINIDDLDILKWFIHLIRLNILNGMYHLQTTGHPAKDRVLGVEIGSRTQRDEELRTCIRSPFSFCLPMNAWSVVTDRSYWARSSPLLLSQRQ